MDISLAAGTYYVSITSTQGASGAIGTGYRLLVTGEANTSSPPPPPPPPPPQGDPPSGPRYDRGSNDRRFPTFGAGVFINGPTVTNDSIGGGDSDDWYAIDVTYTRVGNTLPVSITLTGAANAGIELYRSNERTPFDQKRVPGQMTKNFEPFLAPGRYLIHMIPLATPSPASNYVLTIFDRGATR